MNVKVIGAIRAVRDGLTALINELEDGVDIVESAPVVEETPKKAVVEEKLTGTISEEQLEGMTYNELKKFAKSIGVPATGSRDELTKKILSAEVEIVDEEEEVRDEKPARKTKSKKSKPEIVEEDEEDEDEDNLEELVLEAVEDMSDEDIMDVLTDVGVKAKGKRQALISAVVKAVRDGKIDLGDEDEYEEDEAEVEEEDLDEDYDDEEDTEEMTEERSVAIEAFRAEAYERLEEGDITRQDLIDWLNEFNQTNDKMKKLSDEDIVEEYVRCSSVYIDDEGVLHDEEGAYYVNDVPYCCGAELEEVDNGNLSCQICETEYEVG